MHNSGEHKTGFIDRTGKLVIKPKFRDAYSFSEGLAEVRDNGKSGYIDKTGKVVIPLQFDSASSFSEGLARVFFNGKYGFIDRTGKFVIEPQFSSACEFSEGIACVKIGGVVLEPYSMGTMIPSNENAVHGYIDKTGKLVLKLDDVEGTNSFSEGLGRFYKNGNPGFIDKTGKIIIEPKYTTYSEFSEGLKSVYLNNGNGYGWIDKEGNVVLKTDFGSADDFHNGLAQVAEGDYPPTAKYGYINKTGKVIWQPTK